MKTGNLFVITIALIFALNFQSFAQRGQGRAQNNCANLPELTQEQQTKIQDLRTAQIAQTTAHRARMDELRAQKQSMRIAENPDMNQINAIIDQMSALRAEHMKATVAHQQSIREILTPEQRVVFDSRTANGPRFENKAGNRGNFGRGDRSPRGGRRN